MTDFVLQISNMHCGTCIRRVSQALESTQGIQVKEIRIGLARLSFDENPLLIAQAISALNKAGYTASVEE